MSNYDHIIYNSDPVLMKSYVNKRCSITTLDNKVHTGVIYTIDPVSDSFILLEQIEKDKVRLKIINGHAVRESKVLSHNEEETPRLFEQAYQQQCEKFVADRKKAVTDLLMENRFPVTEKNNVLIIEGIVAINPPYRTENCVSTNPIVLTRIHSLLSQLQ